jgi:Zn-dependent peptidase ImmA (M78 family)
MSGSKRKGLKALGCSNQSTAAGKVSFSSPLALGLCAAVPSAEDPVAAILWHARRLIAESGIVKPPFRPASFAHLRRVKKLVYKTMQVEGCLIPYDGDFIIELRKDRPYERMNFTCAHELGHTFFYESVPSIKYRTVTSSQPHHDPEEERLCNIAAAELLMPSDVFRKISRDYSPSPQSLQLLAQTFESSLIATIVRLLNLKVWGSKFICWQMKDDRLKARWLAQPGRGLAYFPNLEIINPASSGIYHTATTIEATASAEWLSLDGGYKLCNVSSMCLSDSKTVLSCITNGASHAPARDSEAASSLLPLEYGCECDGNGWRLIKQAGRNFVTRCRAPQHKKSH